MISPARLIAFRVLERVEQGGYASDLLLKEAAPLDTRDAGLASEIVFGCLRHQAQLDFLIRSATGERRLDTAVRTALRMGLYQLRYLNRIPAHAAVSESVELVRKARKASAAGLVNATLRRAPLGAVDWPSRAVALSMPPWLLKRWDAEFGSAVSESIAADFLRRPEVWVRNPPSDRTDLVLEPAEIERAFRVVSGDVRGLRIQDVGSQSVVPWLQLMPGQMFLDLCAAPGNKTAQALESGVTAIACDLHWHRLKNFTASGCSRVALDASRPLPFQNCFDRILVDAPCSGTGTLGRNPEIRWKLAPADIEELHAVQVAILQRAVSHLKPDGLLVYSTCSLERRENEDVVAAIPGIRVLETHRRIPGLNKGDGFFVAVITRSD